MEFKIGDKAVVPSHGVGMITGMEDLTIGGDTFHVYVIKILKDGSTYKVPVDKVERNRVRTLMASDTIDEVYEILQDRSAPVDKQTWNRRYREYTNKIKTGDPLEIALVLRDLAILKAAKPLSFGERNMYEQAHRLLVQEISVSRDCADDEIAVELENIFNGKPAKGAKKRKSKAKAKAEPASE